MQNKFVISKMTFHYIIDVKKRKGLKKSLDGLKVLHLAFCVNWLYLLYIYANSSQFSSLFTVECGSFWQTEQLLVLIIHMENYLLFVCEIGLATADWGYCQTWQCAEARHSRYGNHNGRRCGNDWRLELTMSQAVCPFVHVQGLSLTLFFFTFLLLRSSWKFFRHVICIEHLPSDKWIPWQKYVSCHRNLSHGWIIFKIQVFTSLDPPFDIDSSCYWPTLTFRFWVGISVIVVKLILVNLVNCLIKLWKWRLCPQQLWRLFPWKLIIYYYVTREILRTEIRFGKWKIVDYL